MNEKQLAGMSKLYDLAEEIHALAPWQWMSESEMFAVQPPHGDFGFISIMGESKVHFGISVYLGAEALHSYYRLMDEEVGEDELEYVLEISQLLLSFDDRGELDAEDLRLIKKLGRRYRGSNAYPQFRSQRPGLVPWYLEDAEVEFLTAVLEQLILVVTRLKDDEELLDRELTEDEYFARVGRTDGGTVVWEDKVVEVPPQPPRQITAVIPSDLVEQAKALPRGSRRLEIDLFVVDSPVMDVRPYFPYLLLVVDAVDSIVLAVKILTPLPSLGDMWESVPQEVLAALQGIGSLPVKLTASKAMPLAILAPLMEQLGVEFEFNGKLKKLPAVKHHLIEHMNEPD